MAQLQSQRSRVLSLYKQILRLSKSWTSATGQASETESEKTYIRTEAQRLFRKNKEEKSPEKIDDFIKEAEIRIGLAQHYGNPYPRLMNIPQHVLAPKGQSSLKKAQHRALKQATPIYLKSYDDVDDR